MFNGIAYDGTDLFVNDVREKQVRRYTINEDHTLNRVGLIEVGRSLDNIEFDPATKKIYGGSIGSIQHHMEFVDRFKHNGFDWPRSETFMPGGAIEIY